MARLLTAGFEAKDLTIDGYTDAFAAWSYTSSPTHGGSQALTNSTGHAVAFALPTAIPLGTTAYLRIYAWITSLPSLASTLWEFYDAANTALSVNASVQTNGTIKLGGALNVISANAIVLGAWNVVELQVLATTGGTSAALGLRLNGVDAGTVTGTGPSVAIGTLRVNGAQNGTGVINIDDIAINDSTGVSQNDYPGPGNVVMLTPISDNAVGTGWTLGTGTAISSNGFDAVNNEPPLGKADLAANSDPWQIRNATSNANVDYKANTGTYLAAGIGLQDPITLVQAVAATAAPSATSPKSGNLGATNPTITLATIGTFENASTLAGTYPSGWKITRSAIVYAPTPTLASGAVLDIQQVTSSTRIAMVSFLGLVVEYVPALPPELMGQPFGLRGQQQMRQLLAQ